MRVGAFENVDQRALRLWLTAGLQIPEVRSLHGDASYLLLNMIAKYTLAADTYAISSEALVEFRRQGVDLSATYSRRAFYGKKKPFIYEHSVPAGIVRSALLKGNATEDEVAQTLVNAGIVAVLLRSEDDHLREIGLNTQMPEGWTLGDDPLARYKASGVHLSEEVLRVKGPIVR